MTGDREHAAFDSNLMMIPHLSGRKRMIHYYSMRCLIFLLTKLAKAKPLSHSCVLSEAYVVSSRD